MNVDELVEEGMAFTFTGAAFNCSSGMAMDIEGAWTATEERTASVTFTTQSAFSFGGAVGVCPTLEISSPDSSTKILLFWDTRRG